MAETAAWNAIPCDARTRPRRGRSKKTQECVLVPAGGEIHSAMAAKRPSAPDGVELVLVAVALELHVAGAAGPGAAGLHGPTHQGIVELESA